MFDIFAKKKRKKKKKPLLQCTPKNSGSTLTKTYSNVQLNSQERNLQELQMQRELKVRIGYRTKRETELKMRVNTWERK